MEAIQIDESPFAPLLTLIVGPSEEGIATTQNECYVELYIDRGKESEQENLSIFKQLESAKADIESHFDGELEWHELEGRRACRIRKTVPGGYRDDEREWPRIHEAMVDAMVRLEKALAPHIKRLKMD